MVNFTIDALEWCIRKFNFMFYEKRTDLHAPYSQDYSGHSEFYCLPSVPEFKKIEMN